MAFEGLSEKLNSVFKGLRGKGRLTEEDIKLAMREVRMALLEADVSYKVVKDFVAKVSERAVGAEVLDSLTPAQQVIKIVNEELTALMGGANARLTFANNPPTVVMMVGLQGAGKTTNVAKLAGLLRRQGKRPLLAACDVYRPAAITQLQVVGAQLGLPVFEMGQIDPVTIAVEAVKYARDHGNDIVFLDTAGRLHIDEQLMDELKRVKAAVKPNEILLVVDAMTGQERRSPSARRPESPSNTSARAKSSTCSSPSTPTAWPPASSAWAMCSASSKRRSSTSTRRRRRSSRKSSRRTASPSPTTMNSSCSCAAWATSASSPR